MSDATFGPQSIEEIRKEIECLAKISEEKDAQIEALRKSTQHYMDYFNQTLNRTCPLPLMKKMKFHPRDLKVVSHPSHAATNVPLLISRLTSPTLKEGST